MDQTQLNSSRSGAAVPLQTPRLDKATKVSAGLWMVD